MKAKNLILSAGLVLGLSVALVGCSDTVEEVGTTDVGATEETTTETENKVYSVGDTVSVNGLDIAITEASFTEPDQYTEATNGKVLTLEISAVNNSDSVQSIFSGDFNVYDSKGNGYEEYYGYDESSIYADLNKGKQAKGMAYYDVAEDTTYEVIYTTWLGTEVKFNIEM